MWNEFIKSKHTQIQKLKFAIKYGLDLLLVEFEVYGPHICAGVLENDLDSGERRLSLTSVVLPIYLDRHHVTIFALVGEFEFFLPSLNSFVNKIYIGWIFLVEVEAHFIDEQMHELSVTLVAKPEEYGLLFLFNHSSIITYFLNFLFDVTDGEAHDKNFLHTRLLFHIHGFTLKELFYIFLQFCIDFEEFRIIFEGNNIFTLGAF